MLCMHWHVHWIHRSSIQSAPYFYSAVKMPSMESGILYAAHARILVRCERTLDIHAVIGWLVTWPLLETVHILVLLPNFVLKSSSSILLPGQTYEFILKMDSLDLLMLTPPSILMSIPMSSSWQLHLHFFFTTNTKRVWEIVICI